MRIKSRYAFTQISVPRAGTSIQRGLGPPRHLFDALQKDGARRFKKDDIRAQDKLFDVDGAMFAASTRQMPDGTDQLSLALRFTMPTYCPPGVSRPGRYGWLQVARGSVKLNGKELKQGDGAAISDEKQVTIEGVESAEVLLFDLA